MCGRWWPRASDSWPIARSIRLSQCPGKSDPVGPDMRGSDQRAQRGVQHQAGEQDQTGVAVGLEYLQAIVRIADVEANDLPGEMGGERGQPQREDHAGAGKKPGKP